MAPPPSGEPLTGPVLDHVAVAVEEWTDAWPRYAGELGAAWSSGGYGVGFAPAQLRFANAAKLEILQPWETGANPFLRRFLDSSGPGPHHLTFKVPDLDVALNRVRAAGFEPQGIDRSDPGWMEAFLHPRQATGVVVQLAQATEDWDSPPLAGYPAERPPAASLLRVVHAVPDLAAALGLFQGLLDGVLVDQGSGPEGTWDYAELTWPGPLAVRLISPRSGTDPATPVRLWLADRPGRVHHLAFTLPGGVRPAPSPVPRLVPGVLPAEGPPVTVVEPAENLGTRLVLLAAAP
jgi:catechol 2,3-dioxygenase-like lactoylglutathione lyase family enzyme